MLAALIFALVFALGVFAIQDLDLGFHLSAGRLISETHTLPLTDRFTFTRTGFPDFSHDLLPAWILDRLQALGGWPTLIVVKALLIAATFTLAFHLAHHHLRRVNRYAWITVTLTLVAAVIARPRFFERPYLITYLFLMILVWLLQHWRSAPSNKLQAAILLLFALWFNAHIGVVYGVAVLLLFWFSLLVFERRGDLVVASAGLLAPGVIFIGLVSAVVNPSSGNLWTHLWIETQNRTKIAWNYEYQSGWTAYPAAMTFMAASALIAGVFAKRRREPLPGFYLLCFAMFFILVSRYRREIFPLTLFWLLLCGERLLCLPALRQKSARWTCGVVALGLFALEMQNPRFIPRLDLDRRFVPRASFAAVAEHFKVDRIYNSVGFGGWWSYFYGPASQIFHDGRGPLYDERFFKVRVLPLLQWNDSWAKILDDEDVDVLLIEPQGLGCETLVNDGYWTLVYFDDDVAAFARPDADFPDGYVPFSLLSPCDDDLVYWQSPGILESREFNREVQSLLRLNPQNPRALALQSLAQAKRGDFNGALQSLLRVKGMESPSLTIDQNAGRLACAVGKFGEAEEAFTRAERLAPQTSVWTDWQACRRHQKRHFAASMIQWRQWILGTYLRWR